jgi:molecular chaperone GrpE
MSDQTRNDSSNSDPVDSDATEDASAALTSDDDDGMVFDAIAAAAEFSASLTEVDVDKPDGMAASGESYEQILESELEALTVTIAQKEALLRKANARADLAYADIEESKARIARESAKVLERRTRKLLLGFVDVLDDFDRALASARELDHNPEVIQGIELVRKRFASVLAGFGVTHSPALGQTFDPNIHEAVTTVTVTDDRQHGTIVGVILEGYAISDEILRAAKVAVGKSK